MTTTEPRTALDTSEATVLDRRYRLDDLIGIGEMAEVYSARDLVLKRDVAVKLFHQHLLDEPTTLARARSEVTVLARLNSPHLIRLYDASLSGSHPGHRPYLVLELVEGGTLGDAILEGPLTPARVARIGQSLALALSHVHDAGVVHGDVKPANVLLSRHGQAKLADFGIAMSDGAGPRAPRTVVGTAGYLAPEQVRGSDATPAWDVYALGIVLLECLTGLREFPGSDAHAAVARLRRPPLVPDGLPRGWRELLAELTATDPAQRPCTDAVHQRLALLTATDERALPAEDDGTSTIRTLTAAAAALVVLASVGGGVLAQGDSVAPRPAVSDVTAVPPSR